MADNPTTTFDSGEIVTVLRRGKTGYRAVVGTVESSDFCRLTVRPLPDQGETDRARSVWRRSVLKMENQNG